MGFKPRPNDGTATNVFEAIKKYGHDEDWEGVGHGEPTQFLPGSHGKIEAMRRRVELGLPLFEEDDRADYDGTTVGQCREDGSLIRQGLKSE